MRECFYTIQLRGRPKLRRSSGQRHKEVNTGHENEVAESREASEPVSTWSRLFSEFLNDIADVQDELLLSSNPNADRAKSTYRKRPKAPRLQHQQQTQQTITRRTSESVC